MQYQRHSFYLQIYLQSHLLQSHLLQSHLQSYLQKSWRFIHRTIATASLLGVCLAISAIAERGTTYAQTTDTLTQINDILAQVTFGDDQLTRYAAAANAIENKRLEIFRTAKNNSNWIDVANLAESKHTKVCDLSQPPDFLVDLCSQLRSFTEKEIRRQGFTNKEFNQITREQRQNPYLRGLIQSKQMQLRNSK